MVTEIKYIEDEDLVLFKTSGTYEVSDNVKSVKAFIGEFNTHNCLRYLIDHSETDVTWKVTSTYNRPTTYLNWGYKTQIKVALVFKQLTKDTAFYENVCVNKGLNIKVFDNRNDAITWLKSTAF